MPSFVPKLFHKVGSCAVWFGADPTHLRNIALERKDVFFPNTIPPRNQTPVSLKKSTKVVPKAPGLRWIPASGLPDKWRNRGTAVNLPRGDGTVKLSPWAAYQNHTRIQKQQPGGNSGVLFVHRSGQRWWVPHRKEAAGKWDSCSGTKRENHCGPGREMNACLKLVEKHLGDILEIGKHTYIKFHYKIPAVHAIERIHPSIYIYLCFFFLCLAWWESVYEAWVHKSRVSQSIQVLYSTSTSFSKSVNLLQKDTTQNQHKYIYFFFRRLFFILVRTDVPHCILIVTSSSPLVHVNFQLITSCCASMVNLFFLPYWSIAPRRNLQKPQTTIKIHIVPHISENQQTGTTKSNYWLWITWSTMSSLLQPKKGMLLH